VRATVLFFSANTSGTSANALNEEVRAIQEELDRSSRRGDFELRPALAARADDVRRTLAEFRPAVVHFAAHGRAAAGASGGSFTPQEAANQKPVRGELVLLDEARVATPLPKDALAQLLAALCDGLRCVVLNAHHSLELADALARHLDGAVIGTTGAVSDRACVAFSKGFYSELFDGRSLHDAFRSGQAAVNLVEPGASASFVLRHRKEADPTRIRLVEPPAAPTPPRATPFFVQSARLEEAVTDVERHLAEGKRIVHLQGAPGDGKTQVGKWLEERRGPSAVYVELPIPDATNEPPDADEIWRQGLVRVIERMKSDVGTKDDFSALCAGVRDAAATLPAPVTLILDNADSTPPFDLQDLLVGQDMACVAIGQGRFAVAKVDLRRPSTDEFIDMVREALAGAPLPVSEEPRVRRIGSLVDHAAIAAGYVADLVASAIPEELDKLERELEAVEFSPDERMRVVLKKAWANLAVESRVVASFLGAFAEPEIPIEWIPEAHRPAGTMASLRRSRLVQAVRGDDNRTLLRAHRLVIQWLRSHESVASAEAIAGVLQAWSIDEELDEVFKSGGPRKRAFNRAFELLAGRGALDALGEKSRAFVELTYIDQSGLHAEGAEDARALERQIDALAPSEEGFVRLHPAVLGQVIDTLRPKLLKHSKILEEKRAQAIKLLDGWRRTLGGQPFDRDDPLRFIAEHHWGKYLAHSDRVTEGLDVLRGADDWASAVLQKIDLHDRRLWLTRRTKVRLQIADALGPHVPEARRLLSEEYENAELPIYLRLTAANRLLKHSGPDLGKIVQSGLDLYRICGHDEVAADFLASAVSTAREQGAEPVLDEIDGIAGPKLDLLLGGGPGSRRRKVAVAFTNAKAAEGRTSGDALSVLGRAMKLLGRVLDPEDEYHRTRALAMVRDAGALHEAGIIADIIAAPPTEDHFSLYELARTMRWIGRQAEAERHVEARAALRSNKRPLTAIYTRDERAKNAAHRGDVTRVEQLLEENIRAAREAWETASAGRFEEWLRALRDGRPLKAPDGVLEDEWRAAERRQNASKEVLEEVQAEAQYLARRIAESAKPQPSAHRQPARALRSGRPAGTTTATMSPPSPATTKVQAPAATATTTAPSTMSAPAAPSATSATVQGSKFPGPVPAAAFAASAALLSIPGLKAMDGPDVLIAMSTLHRVLRASIEPLALSGIRVLSSLTGAIVVVPDVLNKNLHELLPDWIHSLDATGIAVRAGVSRGLVEMVPDADGALNAIGRCINIAARLAASPDNPGVLYEQAYVTQVQATLRRDHFLHPQSPSRTPITVKGKRSEVFECFADPGAPARTACEITGDGATSTRFENAVLLAYDLPDFSDGHLRVLVSRFRGVVQEVQRLREEHGLVAEAGVSFSPGGDGGVLALTKVPLGRAFSLATDLAHLLEAADTTQSTDAPLRARIGVHYGQVLLYQNAEGVIRPTGLTLFDADGLAGDEEARRHEAIVVSGALIESAALGRMPEANGFEEIGAFTTSNVAIRRYILKPRR
jgi:hypothetical protein